MCHPGQSKQLPDHILHIASDVMQGRGVYDSMGRQSIWAQNRSPLCVVPGSVTWNGQGCYMEQQVCLPFPGLNPVLPKSECDSRGAIFESESFPCCKYLWHSASCHCKPTRETSYPLLLPESVSGYSPLQSWQLDPHVHSCHVPNLTAWWYSTSAHTPMW